MEISFYILLSSIVHLQTASLALLKSLADVHKFKNFVDYLLIN